MSRTSTIDPLLARKLRQQGMTYREIGEEMARRLDRRVCFQPRSVALAIKLAAKREAAAAIGQSDKP